MLPHCELLEVIIMLLEDRNYRSMLPFRLINVYINVFVNLECFLIMLFLLSYKFCFFYMYSSQF